MLPEMQRQKMNRQNFRLRSFLVFRFFCILSAGYVINKPSEKHVTCQWAEHLWWCWSYKMFLLHLFSRCASHQPEQKMLPNAFCVRMPNKHTHTRLCKRFCCYAYWNIQTSSLFIYIFRTYIWVCRDGILFNFPSILNGCNKFDGFHQ